MISELLTFCTVARHGSMTRAAAELHLSQPAVSQRLRALEENYELPLFRRTNRGVELTPAGEILFRYANRLLNLEKSLQEELDALRTAEPREILIGATSAVGGYALPCTVYLFQQKYPTARIQLQIGKRSEVLQRLEDGLLDMALVEGSEIDPVDERSADWNATVVSEEDLVLITPTTGPLAESEVYGVEDLRRAPLILREPGSGLRMLVEQTWKEEGRDWQELNLAMQLSSMDAVKTSVASGHGVALVSKWCVRVEARMGSIRIVPLEGIRFRSRWTLLHPKATSRDRIHRALLRTLRSPADRGFC